MKRVEDKNKVDLGLDVMHWSYKEQGEARVKALKNGRTLESPEVTQGLRRVLFATIVGNLGTSRSIVGSTRRTTEMLKPKRQMKMNHTKSAMQDENVLIICKGDSVNVVYPNTTQVLDVAASYHIALCRLIYHKCQWQFWLFEHENNYSFKFLVCKTFG